MEVRVFLILYFSDNDYQIKICRDFDTLLTLWREAREGVTEHVSGLIHIGFQRPEVSEIKTLLAEYSGLILVTEPVTWILPSQVEFSDKPVGYCSVSQVQKQIPIYLGLSGWGYDFEENSQAFIIESEAEQSLPISDEPSKTESSDWIAALAQDVPNLYGELVANRINSDYVYLDKRSSLASAIQTQLDNYRYLYFISRINKHDPFEILKYAPLWLLESEVTSLDIPSVRVRNVLIRSDIKYVADISKYNLFTITSLKNFGRKSIHDLANSLHSIIVSGCDASDVVLANGYLPHCDIGESLAHNIDRAISTLKDSAQEIFKKRLGYDGPKQTLVAIGEEFGVTRERIRQIEAKALGKIRQSCHWVSAIRHKLQVLFENRDHPLYLDLLEVEDRWFSGFSDNLSYLANIIEEFCDGKYKTISVNNRLILSSINDDEWEDIQQQTIKYFSENANSKLLEEEVILFVKTTASSNGIPELSDLLLESVSKVLHFASPKGEGPRQLVSVGRGLNHLVKAIMVEAKEPLHYSEFTRRCSERLGEQADIRRVHNALPEVGGKLYGRGKYGLSLHFPLDEETKYQILDEIELLILGGSHGRQWHCVEILEALEDKRPDLTEYLDHYLINIILEESNLLHPLGRLVWIVNLTDYRIEDDRIDIAQACTSILENSGRPLTVDEMRAEIEKVRGLQGSFLIQPNERIARLAPALWGYVERDFYLSEYQRQEVLDKLAQILIARQKGLHISEIEGVLRNYGIYIPASVTPYMIMSLAQVEPKDRFRLRRGQILGLTTWQDAKRLNSKEAFDKALHTLQFPTTFDEVKAVISQFAERDVHPMDISRLLAQSDLIYDEGLKTWKQVAEVDDYELSS